MDDLDPNSLLMFQPSHNPPSPPDWQSNNYFENNFPEMVDSNNDESSNQVEYIMETNGKNTTFESALEDLDLKDLVTNQSLGSEEPKHSNNFGNNVLSKQQETQFIKSAKPQKTVKDHFRHEMKKRAWRGQESPAISDNSKAKTIKTIQKKNKERKLYACDLCDFKPTRYSTNYIRHKLSVHDKIRWKCNFCDKTYSTEDKLDRHTRKEHAKPINTITKILNK